MIAIANLGKGKVSIKGFASLTQGSTLDGASLLYG